MKQNQGRKEEVQKGSKNAIKKEKKKNTVEKKEEKSMKARKQEETRKGMRRFAATDDPRSMSVSLRPQNKQLSKKDEKKGGKLGGAKNFLREKHEVFSNKNCKKDFLKKWSVEICSVFEIKEMRIQRRDLNEERAQTKIF